MAQPPDISKSLGSHFIIGLKGPVLNGDEKKLLTKLQPLGIILQGQNFEKNLPYPSWLSRLKKLIDEVKKYSGRSKPVIALDHEGGRVHRTPPPLTHFPSALKYSHFSKEVGRAMGKELRSLGVNMLLGPVADIWSNPKNTVIAERAFGKTPKEVIPPLKAFLASLQASGIIPVGKHFPGHGDSVQDSHTELPFLKHTMQQLKKRELLPFIALIKLRIPAILSAHLFFPDIDDQYPASLSKIFLDELLRKELKFEGVLISDDMDMLAIKDNYEEDILAKRIFKTHTDILLFNHHPKRALKVARTMQVLLKQDKVYEKILQNSERRIKKLLKKLSNTKVYALNPKVLKEHGEIL